MIMHFGKYKNKPIKEVPHDYLKRYLSRFDQSTVAFINALINPPAPPPPVIKINKKRLLLGLR